MDSKLIKINFFTNISEYTNTLEKDNINEVLDSIIIGMKEVGYTNNEIKEAFKQKFFYVLLNNN
jgi:DNA-binding transcriptional regulator YhcF (GntR family)